MFQEPFDLPGADAARPSAGLSGTFPLGSSLFGESLAPAPQGDGARFGEGEGFPPETRGLLALDDLPGEASAGSGDEENPHWGRLYERELIESVWRFAETVPGVDPDLWRRDELGDWIHRPDYGRRASRFGWEIFDPGHGRHSQGVFALRPMQRESYIAQIEAFS